MKTPMNWLLESHKFDNEWHDKDFKLKWLELIEAIQLDALGTAILKNSDKELANARAIASNERIRANQLHEEMMKWREKYHEARRYLRQANKGAERNNMVMRLQAQTINKMLLKTKQ
jgi:hypothetical protein